MSITIYSSGGTLKYTLNSILASRVHQSLNGECTMDFSMPGRLIHAIAIGDEVRLGDLYFHVCRISKNTQVAGAMYNVSCEHISYDLADQEQDATHFSGTPASVLATILTGTGFSAGTVTVTGTYSITINQATSKRDALQQWAAACGAEISYYQQSINLLTRVGSTVAVSLSDKENVKSLSVTLDSRSDTQTYAVQLSRLQHLSLGDAVTIQYSSLNLNVSTRVITLDYDPFHPMAISMVTGDYVPNFTGAVTAALEARLKEGQPYFGVTIDRENGIKIERSDGASEAIFNSDVFAMRAEIDGVMKDRIYFDPIKGDYVFDGALGADAILAGALYAETGDIAELTVDRLSTSRRIRKYILSDASDDNYIQIQDNYIRFITGAPISSDILLTEAGDAILTEAGLYLTEESNGIAVEQAKNRNNQPLYWQREPVSHTADGYPLDADGVQIYATTDVTDWPVNVYVYLELTKAQEAFEIKNSEYVPIFTFGAGDENGRNKGFIQKTPDGLDIVYTPTAGGEIGINALAEGYLDLSGLRKPTELDFSRWDNGLFTETVDGGGVNSWVITFDANDRPIKFIDGDGHETDVIWETTP